MDDSGKRRFFDIVIAKCEEREMQGGDSLNSSDVTAILEQCSRENITVSREDLQICGLDHLSEGRNPFLPCGSRRRRGGKAWHF